jgi:hypothetical protein
VGPHASADKDTGSKQVTVRRGADLGDDPAAIRALNEGKWCFRVPAAVGLLGWIDLLGFGGVFGAFLDG